jgi:hypothetical protein
MFIPQTIRQQDIIQHLMSDIDSNIWDDKKQEPFLNPRLIEKPLIEEDRYKDFDDLVPRRGYSGFRWRLDCIFAMIILMVFLLIMLLYWIKWG